MATSSVRAITFDFGQTLADLDAGMLSRRLSERSVFIAEEKLDSAVAVAFEAYGRAIQKGLGGHPWRLLMRRLLEEAGGPASRLDELAEWLFHEQPSKNLWRRPVPGMIELVRDLRERGIPVGIISNSEGRLAELIEELGHGHLFHAVADSGKLGLEKPGAAIFAWTAERLGVRVDEIVHVGDAYAADVAGALGAGARAVWFRGDPDAVVETGGRVHVCPDARAVRLALQVLGIDV